VTLLQPFRATLYDDPTGDPGDGVVDMSALVNTDATNPLEPSRLTSDSTAWASAHASGHLRIDEDEPALYMVRVGWRDADGSPWQRAGVVGVTGNVGFPLPDLETVIVSESSFDDLLVPEGVPLVRCTTPDGKHFRLWPIRRPGVQQLIAEAVDRFGHPAVDAGQPFALATTNHFTVPRGLLFPTPNP
jgi:hypothetical protein